MRYVACKVCSLRSQLSGDPHLESPHRTFDILGVYSTRTIFATLGPSLRFLSIRSGNHFDKQWLLIPDCENLLPLHPVQAFWAQLQVKVPEYSGQN